jgi:hypothetical protein
MYLVHATFSYCVAALLVCLLEVTAHERVPAARVTQGVEFVQFHMNVKTVPIFVKMTD